MMLEELVEDKELYLFELDDVLFPKRDYLVQVYYLFGSFLEFTESVSKANDIAKFMTRIYDLHGEESVFLATKTMFGIDDKYEENFHRLIANAQIPIKLDLFPHMENLLFKINSEQKKIAILTKGNPVEQLNKLKFIDWRTLDFITKSLKVFFTDELEYRSFEPIEFISNEYNIDAQKIIYID